MQDFRKYRRQTNFRYVIGFAVLLLVIGEGLIAFFYGIEGALTGLLCLAGMLLPIGLIVLILWIIDRIVKTYHDGEG